MAYFTLATKLLDVMPRAGQFQVYEWLRKRLYFHPPAPPFDPERHGFNPHSPPPPLPK